MNYLLIGSNVLMLATYLLRMRSIPPTIPLFYSRAPQEFQLAPWWMIFILPVSMNALFYLNKFLTKKMFLHNTFVKDFMNNFYFVIIPVFTLIFLKIIFLIS
jgi:hypothetical protein